MERFAVIGPGKTQLANGIVVDREMWEMHIMSVCHYVQHVVMVEKDRCELAALIFPNMRLLSNPDYEKTPEEGCFCPRSSGELGMCLFGCLQSVNKLVKQGYARLTTAIIVKVALSEEEGTLNWAQHINVEAVLRKYGRFINESPAEGDPEIVRLNFET